MAKLSTILKGLATSAHVILGVGAVYSLYHHGHRIYVEIRQKEIEDVISDLASSGEDARLIAALYTAEFFVVRERIPLEVYGKLISNANASDRENVRDAGKASIARVINSHALRERDLAPYVKISVSIRAHADADPTRLNRLKDDLRSEPALLALGGFLIHEKIIDRGPSNPEVRCFSKRDCEAPATQRLVDVLKASGIPAEKNDQSGQYETVVVMRRSYEIWLPPGVPKTDQVAKKK